MENVLLIVLLLLALALIGVVLLQRSEGGGLGMGGGGGGAMSQRSAANAMTKLTWVFGIAFMAVSLTLTVISARNAEGTSVMDRFGGAPAAAEDGEIDTDALLPPPSTIDPDAPLVPRAD
ncbi:preprotein translocase subunit SecG [Cognatishimia sp. F0-27]|uniref:preprotein translocase subunit SecG n=1 Tax=Cognatishimia sp. F0-27 TaxID=2816855 RepID=UPI001D0C55B4|nr:preprotein translocase subunit SecG [Cognatishimia sp. F0-27]MCC1493595.1 preprotein translocase subunit SecG [Cognatishimia sp. F0-27]